MRLYFVRHGESEANILQEISNRGWKHGLTEKGRTQARQLANQLATVKIARIYTSPLRRAVETAHILGHALDEPVEVTQALIEYDCGIIEGKSDAHSWQIHREMQQTWLLHQQWDQRIPGGESFLDIQQRFVPFIENLTRARFTANTNYILLGHGGTYTCMLPLVLQNISFEFAMQQAFPNTAYVLTETAPQGILCREWCGTESGIGHS